MKSALSFYVALLAANNALALPEMLRPRQATGLGGAKSGLGGLLSGFSGAGSEKAPDSVTTIPSKMRLSKKDTMRKKLRYGPYRLAGANVRCSFWNDKTLTIHSSADLEHQLTDRKETRFSFGEKGTSMLNVKVSPICQDCIVLAGGMGLEYPDGTVADTAKGIYNHHLTISAMGKPSRMMICPGSFNIPTMSMTPLLGTASDGSKQLYTTEDGEFNSGFFVKKGQQHYMSYQLINYKPTAQEIYIVAEFEYIPELKAGFLDATLSNLVPNCARLETFLDKKVESFVSKDYTVPQDGYILNTQGHLHNGGDSVELFLNGKSVCLSKAEYSTNGNGGMGKGMSGHKKRDEPVKLGETIATITKCTKPIPIKKGDRLKVSANFDLNKHPLRTTAGNTKVGVMGFGIIMFAFPPGVLP